LIIKTVPEFNLEKYFLGGVENRAKSVQKWKENCTTYRRVAKVNKKQKKKGALLTGTSISPAWGKGRKKNFGKEKQNNENPVGENPAQHEILRECGLIMLSHPSPPPPLRHFTTPLSSHPSTCVRGSQMKFYLQNANNYANRYYLPRS
jgi:hypothetical protein